MNASVPAFSANLDGGTMWADPVATFMMPMPITSSAMPTNMYVGMAKMLPDSRTPRRFAAVTRMMITAPSSTLYGLMTSK